MMETIMELGRGALNVIAAAHPGLLFLALALLPLAGVPTSPLWIAAGLRLGTEVGFLVALSALVLNYTVGYWLARRWLRAPLAAWLERRGWRLPELSPGDETLAIVGLRVTPGLPLFVQNYLLGLAEVSFTKYLVFSILIQAPQVLAFVWFGQSLAANAWWKVLLAVAALIGLSLLVILLRRCLKRRAPATFPVLANPSES